jgi:hypothetical protein
MRPEKAAHRSGMFSGIIAVDEMDAVGDFLERGDFVAARRDPQLAFSTRSRLNGGTDQPASAWPVLTPV